MDSFYHRSMSRLVIWYTWKYWLKIPHPVRLLLLAYGDPNPHHPSGRNHCRDCPRARRDSNRFHPGNVSWSCCIRKLFSPSKDQSRMISDLLFVKTLESLAVSKELLRMERELKEARKVFDSKWWSGWRLKETGKRGLEDAGDSVDGTSAAGPSKKRRRRVRRDEHRIRIRGAISLSTVSERSLGREKRISHWSRFTVLCPLYSTQYYLKGILGGVWFSYIYYFSPTVLLGVLTLTGKGCWKIPYSPLYHNMSSNLC